MARDFARAFYKSKEWEEVRQGVLMRDKYLCVKCGKPAQEVHHIKHLTPNNILDPKISLNADNLASLCRDCHFDEHRNARRSGTMKANHDRHKQKDAGILPDIVFDADGQAVQGPPV